MNLYTILLSVIVACTAQEVQSAFAPMLTPIKQELYAPSGIVSNQTTYWLTIPGKGQVLIAMHSHNQIPKIDLYGNANFHYVTDNTSPQYKTHFNLPRGLYFFKTNAAKTFISGQGNQYSSTANGYWIKGGDRSKPANKWDESAFIKTNNNYIHPFPKSAIAGMLAPAQPAPALQYKQEKEEEEEEETPVRMAQQGEILDFSLATNNILHDKFYRMNINNQPHKSQAMPLATRQAYFNQAFSSAGKFALKDIICLQEWESNASLQVPQQYTKQQDARWKDQSGGAGLFTYISPRTFSITNTNYVAFNADSRRGFLVTYLQTNDVAKRKLAIINTHFAGGDVAYTKTQSRIDQMQEIAQYIQANSNQASSWIVCGDLNEDAAALPDTLLDTLNSSGITFADAEVRSSAARPATSYNKGDERIDYIFYTPATLQTNGAQYSNQSELLSHGHLPGDYQKPYYSDHAIVSAKFTFKKASAPAPQPSAQDIKPIALPQAWWDGNDIIKRFITEGTYTKKQILGIMSSLRSGIDLAAKNPKDGKTIADYIIDDLKSMDGSPENLVVPEHALNKERLLDILQLLDENKYLQYIKESSLSTPTQADVKIAAQKPISRPAAPSQQQDVKAAARPALTPSPTAPQQKKLDEWTIDYDTFAVMLEYQPDKKSIEMLIDQVFSGKINKKLKDAEGRTLYNIAVQSKEAIKKTVGADIMGTLLTILNPN